MISATALAKIKVHQECLVIKEEFNVKDFYIYNVAYAWGYGISTKENLHSKSVLYKHVNDPVGRRGTLERMAGVNYKVLYIDEEKECDTLGEFLEYYYIVKIAGI